MLPRHVFCAFSLALLATLVAPFGSRNLAGDQEGTDSLIKKLGSKSFDERQAATKVLFDRPNAAPALRDALRSSDSEVARRAALILDHFDRRPIRELDAAVKNGDVEGVIKLVVEWPAGKNEEEAYSAVRKFARTLVGVYRKQGGDKTKLDVAWLDTAEPPIIISAKRIDEAMRIKEAKRLMEAFPRKERFGHFFLRAGEVDLDQLRNKSEGVDTGFFPGNLIVASGSIRLHQRDVTPFILADGNVEVAAAEYSIIISRGSVTMKGNVHESLIIANGKVTCSSYMMKSRIISGKSVNYQEMATTDSKITENEVNPLGFIRFGNAPGAESRAK